MFNHLESNDKISQEKFLCSVKKSLSQVIKEFLTCCQKCVCVSSFMNKTNIFKLFFVSLYLITEIYGNLFFNETKKLL